MPQDGGVVLLAAGKGLRFGADKRLHTLASGDAVLLATVKRYAEAFDQIVVVIRPGETHVARMLSDALGERAVTIVHAADAHLGMGHSLAAGIQAIRHWSYAFVALADMPFVRASTLTALRAAMNDQSIVVPTFDGRPGHPVGFARDYFPALAQLGGDSGARAVIEANRAIVDFRAVDDIGVLRDIDRPEDIRPEDDAAELS